MVALEAHPSLAQVLAGNAARNGLTNVAAFNLAAGPENGAVEYPAPPLSLRGDYGDLALHLPPQSTRRVPMVQMDEIAPVDTRVAKIDVQGFQPEVLKGAGRLLRDVRPVRATKSRDSAVRDQLLLMAADWDGLRVHAHELEWRGNAAEGREHCALQVQNAAACVHWLWLGPCYPSRFRVAQPSRRRDWRLRI